MDCITRVFTSSGQEPRGPLIGYANSLFNVSINNFLSVILVITSMRFS